MKNIAFTHCGKLGDMLYCLPIMAATAQREGVPIDIVLPQCFPPFQFVKALLLEQPFVRTVTLVDHPCNWHGHAGQPYKFDPRAHGVECDEYFNLGFRAYPNKFVTAFVAEEYGLDWDRNFKLTFGSWATTTASKKIIRSEQPEVGVAVPAAEVYPIPMDILALGRLLCDAAERHLWYSGPAAMMFLARVPFHLHYVAGHPPRSIYLPENEFGGNLITPVFSAAPSRP